MFNTGGSHIAAGYQADTCFVSLYPGDPFPLCTQHMKARAQHCQRHSHTLRVCTTHPYSKRTLSKVAVRSLSSPPISAFSCAFSTFFSSLSIVSFRHFAMLKSPAICPVRSKTCKTREPRLQGLTQAHVSIRSISLRLYGT